MENSCLITLKGQFNENVYKSLKKIIHNIASNKIKTNPTIDINDLKQEAWVKILEVIQKNKKIGRELDISYLVKVAQTSILAYCQKESNIINNEDDYGTMVLNEFDAGYNDGINMRKNKLEYDIFSSEGKLNLEEQIVLKMSLESILERIEDKRVKNLIIIRYIKEFKGTSEKIYKMYEQFYESCDDEIKNILDNMSKYTNNIGFKAIGIRATDNISTKIRKEIKIALSSLC